MATAGARLLFLAGFRVVVLERERPLAVRRPVCFAEAVFCGESVVEGVRARRVTADRLAFVLGSGGVVPVLIDPEALALATLEPEVLVEGRMTKTRIGLARADGALHIALGPGFVAGQDVHAVVETQRGPGLGRVIWNGSAEEDSGRPAPVLGVDEARVLRAPRDGTFAGAARIGDVVAAGVTVGDVDGEPVIAGTAGLLRGLIADGVPVSCGMKLGDVDPRGNAVDPAWISDKARAVAAGVLEAVSVGLARRADGVLACAGAREERR